MKLLFLNHPPFGRTIRCGHADVFSAMVPKSNLLKYDSGTKPYSSSITESFPKYRVLISATHIALKIRRSVKRNAEKRVRGRYGKRKAPVVVVTIGITEECYLS